MGLLEGIKKRFSGVDSKVVVEDRGLAVSDTASMFNLPQLPPADLSAFEDIYRNKQGYVKAGVDFWTNAIAGVGFYTSVNNQESLKSKEYIDAFCEKINLDNLTSRAVKNALIYGFCPILKLYDESNIVKVNSNENLSLIDGMNLNTTTTQEQIPKVRALGKLERLKILPSTHFFAARDKYGKILFYQQKIMGNTVNYAPEEIWLCQWNVIGTDIFGTSILNAIYETINIKGQAISDMGKIIKRYGAPKVVWITKTKADRDVVVSGLDSLPADKDPVFAGEVEFKPIQIDPRAAFQYFYEFLDYEILEGLGAPLLSYLRTSTQASSSEIMDKVNREIAGVQRYLKREIEAQVFKPILEQSGIDYTEIPRLNWGAIKTGLEGVDIAKIASLVQSGALSGKQARELLRKLGLPIEEEFNVSIPTGTPTTKVIK